MKPARLYKYVFIIISACVLFDCRRLNKQLDWGNNPNITSDTGRFVNGIVAAAANRTPLNDMFGVNGYEWNFLENPASPNVRNVIYEDNMRLIKSFSALRHYLNWDKLEPEEGKYTFNPTNDGGWYYDLIYSRCKQDSVLVLADLKNLPNWMEATYPADQRDDENVPVPYGMDRTKAASYTIQARTAFQFAARYGSNTRIDPTLVEVDDRPQANGAINEKKIGLGLIRYIECGNENDRWWKGDKATQSPEEYAANLSAFYDGHKGILGKDAGIKTADPAMQVVMSGLASADTSYVRGMINWCKKNRGLKADGNINLCFDVINYHLYSNDGDILKHKRATKGLPPELSEAGAIADGFVKLANSIPGHPEVWLTEAGYDINQESYQHAPPIGNKSAEVTQADWVLRTSLHYLRHGIKRVFFYQLFDAFPGKGEQYATSGLAESPYPRPALNYIRQVSQLMGKYQYAGTLKGDVLVDKFTSSTNQMYVFTVPDQIGREADRAITLPKYSRAMIYVPQPGSNSMIKKEVRLVNHRLVVHATETPTFVKPLP